MARTKDQEGFMNENHMNQIPRHISFSHENHMPLHLTQFTNQFKFLKKKKGHQKNYEFRQMGQRGI